MRTTDDRPVVVGVNGPPHTYRRAVAFALREAALRRTAVRLVHGCQPSGGRGSAQRRQPTDEQQRQARRQLRGAAQLARQFSADDSSVICCIYPGSGVDALLEESRTAAIVVTQRREMSELRGQPLGSTTSAVTAMSRCPIVVLKPDSLLGPPRAGVVVGIDGSLGSQYALNVGFEEAGLRATPLTVASIGVHPSAKLSADARQAATGSRHFGGSGADWGLTEALARYRQLYPNLEVRHDVVGIEGVVTASIGAELVVVGPGQRADSGSAAVSAVARDYIDALSCPVMIVSSGQGA